MTAICVDAGTSMIKAVGYDADGREQVVRRSATTVSRPRPAWAEQDMLSVWQAVATSIAGVARQLTSPADFVAITAQGDGAWLVDSGGSPTGPAILWNDGRAAAQLQSWDASGVLAEAFSINGSWSSSGMPNAILSWLQEHDPARLERSATVLTCGGWVFSQLTGERITDESDASAPFLDIRARAFSQDLLELYALGWAQRLLPELRDDGHRVGRLSDQAAARIGLRAGTPVVIAPYDIATTAIGAGAVSAGQACVVLGTTLCTELVTSGVDTEGVASGITVTSGVPGHYLRAFPTLAGGEVVNWACDLLGLSGPSELGALAQQGPPGAAGLCFLPYLSPAGERAPFLDPQARGSLLGLSLEHSREHIARSIFEGLTLVIQDCLRACGPAPSQIRACGGGSASPWWLQLLADVTDVPVVRSADTEAGARGAFIVGTAATGQASSVQEAAGRFARTGETFTPEPDLTDRYRRMFADFLDLRQITASTWPRLAGMRDRTPDHAPGDPA